MYLGSGTDASALARGPRGHGRSAVVEFGAVTACDTSIAPKPTLHWRSSRDGVQGPRASASGEFSSESSDDEDFDLGTMGKEGRAVRTPGVRARSTCADFPGTERLSEFGMKVPTRSKPSRDPVLGATCAPEDGLNVTRRRDPASRRMATHPSGPVEKAVRCILQVNRGLFAVGRLGSLCFAETADGERLVPAETGGRRIRRERLSIKDVHFDRTDTGAT